MKIIKQLAILGALGAVALAGCSSKMDANEKNFGAALAQYFEKKGDLCLRVDRWPVELSQGTMQMQKSWPTGALSQMAALEAAGLVLGEDAEVDVVALGGIATGVKAKVKRYSLTTAAKPYTREMEVESIGFNGRTRVKSTSLCWGNQALDKIIKWEGPMKLGDYQEAVVMHTYKVTNVADWAKRPEVQAAFPYVKQILEMAGTQEAKRAVKLTSQGWEAKGLD